LNHSDTAEGTRATITPLRSEKIRQKRKKALGVITQQTEKARRHTKNYFLNKKNDNRIGKEKGKKGGIMETHVDVKGGGWEGVATFRRGGGRVDS